MKNDFVKEVFDGYNSLMSGHSHWATTQRAKGIKDKARGKLFSKLSRAITIAVKEGGGPDITANYKLRIAVETAKASNMPKDNIERAINNASQDGKTLTEVLYEGFGPAGVGVLIEATTDNKNRSSQLMKNMLEKAGGSLGGPNTVSFNFSTKGFLAVKKTDNFDEQLLTLIDCGVEDYEELDDRIDIYVDPSHLFSTKEDLTAKGMEVLEARLIKKPVTVVELSEKDADKLAGLVEALEELDEVDNVFVNAA